MKSFFHFLCANSLNLKYILVSNIDNSHLKYYFNHINQLYEHYETKNILRSSLEHLSKFFKYKQLEKGT